MHRQAEPMRLALLAVVLACCPADEARRRPARPMRQRDVDRWRARQRQQSAQGTRDDFRAHLARLRQQTIDAKHERPQQPPPQAPTPSYRPAPIPVNITCPATRRGCAYAREGGFGAGLWESATPREDGWMERWHWRLGTEEEYNRTRDALGAWRWRAACEICRMTSPADVARRRSSARASQRRASGASSSSATRRRKASTTRSSGAFAPPTKLGYPSPTTPRRKSSR